MLSDNLQYTIQGTLLRGLYLANDASYYTLLLIKRTDLSQLHSIQCPLYH